MNNPLKYTDPTGFFTHENGGKNYNERMADIKNNKPNNGKAASKGGSDSKKNKDKTTEDKNLKASEEQEERSWFDSVLDVAKAVVPGVKAVSHALNGEWSQAGEALARDAVDMAIGAATLGVGYAAMKAYKAVKAIKNLNKVARKALDECFIKGTLIHTKDGFKPIEQIKVGDLVASKNSFVGKITWKPVVELFLNKNKLILNITLVNSADEEESLGVTAEHPFWVEDLGWVNAEDLQKGQ